jgi:hypothetical protein
MNPDRDSAMQAIALWRAAQPRRVKTPGPIYRAEMPLSPKEKRRRQDAARHLRNKNGNKPHNP